MKRPRTPLERMIDDACGVQDKEYDPPTGNLLCFCSAPGRTRRE